MVSARIAVRSRFPLFLPPALALALLLAVAPAAVAVQWLPAEGGGSLTLDDGTVVHVTQRPVSDLRTLEATVTGLELVLWDELTDDGERQPHYAVIDDGALRGRVRATDYRVELVDRAFDPLTDGQALADPALGARPGNRLYLVQLWATPLPELQGRIADAGGVVHHHLTQHTMVVDLDPEARAEVAALPFVRWIGPFHPEYRLEPVLRSRTAEASLAGGVEAAAERYSILLLERGEEPQQGLGEVVESLGGKVEVTTPQGFRMEATLTGGQLAELIHDERVLYVDRWGGPLEPDMDNVRLLGGADHLEGLTGFTGEGVRGEVFDSELTVTHQEWRNTPLIHSEGIQPTIFYHGTRVTSNVFAQGINPEARGMLPDGQPIFFCRNEATDRHIINEELLDPNGPYRAVFQTASVGSMRTTLYTTISAETDDRLFVHQLLSTQSQSNAGSQDSRPEAWAKNIVSVGGIYHHNNADRTDDQWRCTDCPAASIGPAADGRIKPDLAFYYDDIFSAVGVDDAAYTTFGGTSSATAQTAGHFGLLFQMWHEGVWDGFGGGATVFDSRPHMATAKALMIHQAHRYDWNVVGPNSDLDRFKQGWGTADVRNLYDHAGDVEVLIDESEILEPLESYSTTVEVLPASDLLKATLVYVDPMGVPGAGVHRINDLSLRLTSPTAVVWWGNNGLTASNSSTSGGVSNTLDTVENVFIPTPEAGTWTVEVLADEVVEDSHVETPATDADFALVVSVERAVLFADGFESGNTTAWSSTTP